MTWIRIDETHELTNPRRGPGVRVYGKDGALWPRLSLRVQRYPYGPDNEPSFCVWLQAKVSPGLWWEDCRGEFPIDLLDETILGGVVRLLPLQYLAYFPAAVFLGKVSGSDLVFGMWMQLAWLGVFILASRVTFHFGVRRYSGFGG